MITSDLYERKVMSNKQITLKNNTGHDLHGVKPGGTIDLEADRDGIPLNKEWRRRVKDSKIDNCVSIVKKGKK